MAAQAISRPKARSATSDMSSESPQIVASVRQLIALASAAGRPGRPARIHLHVDTGGGVGCPADGWPLLVAVACRLTRAGRIEVVGVRPGRPISAARRGSGIAAETARLERAVVQARRLGLRAPSVG
jgi:D-serine deaminase-like pyridoxal phosphate-dependent protein